VPVGAIGVRQIAIAISLPAARASLAGLAAWPDRQ
jgi:hypothetical protein